MDPAVWFVLVVAVAFVVGAILVFRRRASTGDAAADSERRRHSDAEANAYNKGVSRGGGAGGA